MSILKQMGIQQWRLKHAVSVSEPTADVSQALARQEIQSLESNESKNAVPEIAQVKSSTTSEVGFDNRQASAAQSRALSSAPEPVPTSPVPISAPLAMPTPAPTPPVNSIATPSPVPSPVPSPLSSPVPTPQTLAEPIAELDWQGLQAFVDTSTQCATCGENRSLLGAGDPNANWLFVIDAPISQDIIAQQLLGARAGQLFEAMLGAVGLDRSSVYTTSVFKCVASDDLSLAPNCDKVLHRQIELVQPQVVITFGEFAAQSAIKANESLDVLRNSEQFCFRTKVPIVPTYTPAQMLDDASLKTKVWQDLKRCLSISATHS